MELESLYPFNVGLDRACFIGLLLNYIKILEYLKVKNPCATWLTQTLYF